MDRTTAPIPFNKPYMAGRELHHVAHAVSLGNISGDGEFTRRCAAFVEDRFGVVRALMTTSCTSALEMAMSLCRLEPGDEVIMPSFTFVSTANAVVRAGGVPVFVDISPDTLNIDPVAVAAAITDRTRSIICVHYAGVSCDMDELCAIATRHDLVLVEDAAHAFGSSYRDRSLGSIAPLATLSFHETKNVVCGEGGALCINDESLVERAEILRDKGTNRQQFFRGEVDKYTWVDVGSSYVPSELLCAFLWGQFEEFEHIQARRRAVFDWYKTGLSDAADDGLLRMGFVPEGCTPNQHIFYILLPEPRTRDRLMARLRERDVHAVFHYVPLHSSPMGRRVSRTANGPLRNTDDLSARLLRLPVFCDLQRDEVETVCGLVNEFLRQ